MWHYIKDFLALLLFIVCMCVLQVLYKEEFEKSKGKGFSVVADTPELQRIKKTQDQISNVGFYQKIGMMKKKLSE